MNRVKDKNGKEMVELDPGEQHYLIKENLRRSDAWKESKAVKETGTVSVLPKRGGGTPPPVQVSKAEVQTR